MAAHGQVCAGGCVRAFTVRAAHSTSSFLDGLRDLTLPYACWSLQVMERDVLAAVKAGAHGVVIGVRVSRLLGSTQPVSQLEGH